MKQQAITAKERELIRKRIKEELNWLRALQIRIKKVTKH